MLASTTFFAIAIKLALKDKNEYSTNKALSKGFPDVVRGNLKPASKRAGSELSTGLLYDENTGELTPCAQLSKQSLL